VEQVEEEQQQQIMQLAINMIKEIKKSFEKYDYFNGRSI